MDHHDYFRDKKKKKKKRHFRRFHWVCSGREGALLFKTASWQSWHRTRTTSYSQLTSDTLVTAVQLQEWWMGLAVSPQERRFLAPVSVSTRGWKDQRWQRALWKVSLRQTYLIALLGRRFRLLPCTRLLTAFVSELQRVAARTPYKNTGFQIATRTPRLEYTIKCMTIFWTEGNDEMDRPFDVPKSDLPYLRSQYAPCAVGKQNFVSKCRCQSRMKLYQVDSPSSTYYKVWRLSYHRTIDLRPPPFVLLQSHAQARETIVVCIVQINTLDLAQRCITHRWLRLFQTWADRAQPRRRHAQGLLLSSLANTCAPRFQGGRWKDSTRASYSRIIRGVRSKSTVKNPCFPSPKPTVKERWWQTLITSNENRWTMIPDGLELLLDACAFDPQLSTKRPRSVECESWWMQLCMHACNACMTFWRHSIC